jgi:hypothetical protein
MSCQHYALCAYDGTEADRCPGWHSRWEKILACMSPHACGCRTKARRRAGLPATREDHLAVHEQARARRGAKPDETDEPEEIEEP